MTFWQILAAIFAAIIALLLLALLVPVTLTLTVDENGTLRLRGRILGVCFYRLPKKKKRIRLSDYSPRAMQRRQRKQQRAEQKKQAKQKSSPTSPAALPADDASLTDKLSFISELSSVILRRSLSLAHVRVRRLAITVGSEDAAKTALLYGAIAPALAFLLETLEQFSHLHIAENAPVGVSADFTSEHCRADIHVHFRLHVMHLLIIGVHALKRIFAHHIRKSKHRA